MTAEPDRLSEPPRDCALCDRLVAFRAGNRDAHPDWFNAPVPSFGDRRARLLVVGLAPGLKGANRTGRPFTGDFAGDLLYTTLIRHGFAHGTYGADPSDGLVLDDCLVTNAVRCVPPENKPVGAEIRSCNSYLAQLFEDLNQLQAVLALGRIAHDAVVAARGLKRSAVPFAHGAVHDLGGPALFDSYHCSRYNTNTGRLTEAMFVDVFARLRDHLDTRRELPADRT